MVHSINGLRGSSVVPIGGDDYMYLGRGRHLWLDNNDIHMSGTTGNTLSQGIAASQNSKTIQMRAVAAAMKLMLLQELDTPGDFLMTCDSGYVI